MLVNSCRVVSEEMDMSASLLLLAMLTKYEQSKLGSEGWVICF